MLKDKVVVIAGAAGLIGRAFVKAVANNGAKVVLGDVNESVAKELAAEVGGVFMPFNITDKASIEACINATKERFGKIDAVVNAAYPRTKSFGAHFFDVSYEDFCENSNLQLGGAFLVMQCFARFFKEQGWGNIISLASIQGVVAPKFETYDGTPMSSPVAYSAIKAGVIHMSKYLAKYLKNANIRVNVLSPGGILDKQNPVFLKQYRQVCLNKGMLDADDMCGALVFLLSDASMYVNGQNIVVDDGFCL